MLFYIFSVLNIITFGLCATEKPILPVTTCKRNSPKYHSCLKNATAEAWPRFVEGLPEFNFPSLEPFLYPYSSDVYDIDNIHGEVLVENMKIYGMKDATIRSVKTHFSDNVFNLILEMYASRMKFIGDFKTKGSIFGFNVISQGTINATTEGMKLKWDFIGSVINDTWIVEHVRPFPTFEKLEFHYKSPTEDTQEFNDIVASIVNSYWPSLVRTVWPTAAKSWNVYLTNLVNNIFSKVSFSTVFP